MLGDGAPIQLLMQDGILSDSKLMFHGFDERDIRGKKEPAQKCVAEYNPGFLQDMRRFLKSDEEMVEGEMCIRDRDWGACLPDGGIFRPVTLLGVEHRCV